HHEQRGKRPRHNQPSKDPAQRARTRISGCGFSSSSARIPAMPEADGPISEEHATDALVLDDDGEVHETRVVGARHAGESFERARLVDVELVRCDLAGCDFSEAQFHRVKLVDCRGLDIELGQASWRDVQLSDCVFTGANFRMAKLRSVTIASSILA